MRIGVNCCGLRPETGGLKQYFVTLFDHLLTHDTHNTYVFFYIDRNIKQLEELSEDSWKKLAIPLVDWRDIRRHLSEIDLYFCPFNILEPRPVSIPSVVTLVDIQETFYPQFFSPNDLLSRAFHLPGSTRAADRVITISNYSKQTLVEHHRISPGKIVVSHLCAHPDFFKTSEAAAPVTMPTSEPFLLYPANDWAHKNHEGLFRALVLLKEKQVIPKLILTGVHLHVVDEKVHRFGLSDQVVNLGYVTRAELAYLYRKARMLVFPSLFEGFGMPVVEAMAAGCPAVVANATSLPEICGDAAEYCDPRSPASIADAIARVWQDNDLCQRLVVRGLRRACDFSPARMAAAHLAAFEEAAASFTLGQYRRRYVYELYHRGKFFLRRRTLSPVRKINRP